jgi:hypothetical protein
LQAINPSEKAAELLGEARKTLSLLEMFGQASKQRIVEALRLSMAEEIGGVVLQERKFQRYMMPGLLEEYHDSKNDIWVMGIPPGASGGEFTFARFETDPKNAETNERVAKEGWRERSAVALTLEAFLKMKEKLKVALITGLQDQNLHVPAKELIYRRMGEIIEGDEGP